MISWLKVWVNQIIVAVIISVIFELIIPNCKSKKYIKIVLGIYILFTIISPVISKITNTNTITIFDYNDYFEEKSVISKYEFEDTNNQIIEDTYKKNIKSDLYKKLEDKGYKVEKSEIDINLNFADENYGRINKLNLWIVKKENDNNFIQVNTINIEEDLETQELDTKEIKKLKEYIKETYQIDINNIEIN